MEHGKADSKEDHPESANGAPCAIQIIAPRFCDEECLEAVKIIDGVLNV